VPSKQALVNPVLVVPNCRLPFELTLMLEKLCPHQLKENGSVTALPRYVPHNR